MLQKTYHRKYFRTPFSAEYWLQAFGELKNTRSLVFAALILALRIAMKPLKIPVAADAHHVRTTLNWPRFCTRQPVLKTGGRESSE